MAIAIYARQSIDKKDSLSIETQIQDCKNQIAREDKNANVVIFKDRGYSGKNTDRPELQKLISEIERENIEKVIVYKLDRISRNIVDFYNLYDFMEKHHCAFYSVKDAFDTASPMGRLLMGILINFAQMERENIQIRVQDSYYARAENDGRWLGGKTPYGFKLGKTKNKISTLKPTEDMEIVKLIYQKYAYDSNSSLHKIVRYLHEEKGIVKSARAIKIILSNPIYVKADERLYNYYKALGVEFLNDKEDWNGINACQVLNKTDQSQRKSVMKDKDEWKVFITNWEGVIDSRTFLMCQERLSENVALSRDNTSKGKFAELSGLVKCKKCGRAIKIKGKYGSMSCIGRSELRGVCDISFRGIRVKMVQEKVGIEMQKYLDNFMENQEKWKQKKEEYQSQIDKLSNEINNLVSLLAENPEVNKPLMSGIEERQKQLADVNCKMQIDVSPSDKIEYRVLKILQQINPELVNVKNVIYEELDEEQKQALLKIVVNKILLDESGNIEIEWKL